MKKFISLLCIFAIILSSFSVFAFAESEKTLPYPDSEYFKYGDYDIHYRVIPAKGTQKGRIMMLHGFLCSTYAWRNLSAVLAENGYECVLADLPNFGFSTREDENMTIVEREKLIIELMKHLAPKEKWILAGHSMGGGVAVNIAEEFPVKALLLYSPAPQSQFPEGREKLMNSDFMKSFMNFFFKYGTKIKPLVRLIIYAATMDWEFTMKYDTSGVTDAVQYDGFGAGLCEMMYNVRATDLENVSKITCPVFICQAEKDVIITQEMKDTMNGAFPDATTYEVAGGGHQCIENRADEIGKATLDFLAK